MKITEKQVLEALSNVLDPDLGKDLVTLKMIEDIKIDGNNIGFEIVLTTPACPLKEVIRKDCDKAIKEKFGDDITMEVTFSSSVTTSRLSGSQLLTGVKNIVAIASGKGGVGKSTTTANIAVALTRAGAKVGIIDADIYGPSIPTMFNCEKEKPTVSMVDGKQLIKPLEQYGVKLLSIGFLAPTEGAIVWRGPMATSALKQFIIDTDWGELDYLLIDLPPGTSDIHLTLVQTVSVTGAVIVTTPQKVALIDARRGFHMFKQGAIDVPILGIIENMAYFSPEDSPNKKYYIFGKDGGKDLATEKGVPLLGEIPLVQSIRESGDKGYPAALKDDLLGEAYKSLAENLASQIAIRNATKEKTKIVEITTG